MTDQANQLGIDTIGGGVVQELFDEELQKVLDNIVDPNKEGKAIREVVIKFKFKPNETRNHVDILVSANSKLGPTRAYPTKAFIGKREDGTGEAFEHNPEQMQFAFDRAQKPSISLNVVNGQPTEGEF